MHERGLRVMEQPLPQHLFAAQGSVAVGVEPVLSWAPVPVYLQGIAACLSVPLTGLVEASEGGDLCMGTPQICRDPWGDPGC